MAKKQRRRTSSRRGAAPSADRYWILAMKQHAPDERHTPGSEQKDHGVPALDGLRAMSIILVLAAHLLPLGPKVLHLNSTAGPMGMSLFFALSGYLIVSTLRSA